MKRVLLIILDGFGVRADQDFNSVSHAKKPYLDKLMHEYASGTIYASEEYVGLPKGQFGNSEVGHLNLGAGRIIRQDITKIDHAIATEEFFTNQAFIDACTNTPTGDVHIMGLLSDGGVHSHQEHIFALISLASKIANVRKIWIHAFLDGRDTPPQSCLTYLNELEKHIYKFPKAKIATVSGRYYAMDRDRRWDRVQLAYDAIVNAKSNLQVETPKLAVEVSYAAKINDEFIKPSCFNQYAGLRDGDSVIFANFRADRAIELTQAFIDKDFSGFERRFVKLTTFVSMTRYSIDLPTTVAYPPHKIENTLGEYISSLGLKQLRIAETEKYPHITYFFNGGEQKPYTNEERIVIDSPRDVATYDLKPEMSLPLVVDKLVEAIKLQQYNLIITNFANGDMVGHTGSFDASIKAVEALDTALSIVVEQMLASGGEVLIVADHGNCEEMYDYTSNQPHTQHTTNVVPCIYVGRKASIVGGGALQDVAPTLLSMMGVAKPSEMTGNSLINFKD